MTYSNRHPVRLVAGRLALDLINTADWSSDGAVVHEKIETLADLTVWTEALGLDRAARPASVKSIRDLRGQLRALFLGEGSARVLKHVEKLRVAAAGDPLDVARRQPLEALLAASALTILGDRRELSRVKMCPGDNCGWLFIDETKNARRRWCSMETCGNRAKASRHYERKKAQEP